MTKTLLDELKAACHAQPSASDVDRVAEGESVWLAGTLVAHAAGDRHFDGVAALLAALGEAPAFASVLVKGSRFMRMEQVVAALAGDTGGSRAH